jgi:hypothetical protein
MSKYLLEDMIKAKRESQETKKGSESEKTLEISETVEFEEIETNYTPNKSRYFLWLVALISVVFFFFGVFFCCLFFICKGRNSC